VLGSLGITIAPEDFLLIIKAFSVNSYTVHQIGFVERIDEIIQQLDCKREGSHCEVRFVMCFVYLLNCDILFSGNKDELSGQNNKS
jgi:hypothetical protein